MSGYTTLTDFQRDGAVIATGFNDVFVWQQGRSIWRILVRDKDQEVFVVGLPYRSKSEALFSINSQVDRFSPDLRRQQCRIAS